MGGTVGKHRELHDTEPFPWTSESLIIPEISRLLLNSKFCYRFPKNRPLCPILSQMKPFHILTHLQVCHNMLSFTLVFSLLRTHPNPRLYWVFCNFFLCQALSLIVRVAANEVISMYMLFFCFLLNCAVQKWERTAECILLRYVIWKVHLVNTALQAGRSRFRFPMMSLEFFIEIILPAALWPWVRLSL
jgi:hypothetical protein